MQLTTIPLSALLAPKGNPRTSYDQAKIVGLAQSIRADGVLQNLLVRPEAEDKFRVVAGRRRYLALQLLKKQRVIDGAYPVPVEVRDDLEEGDALRIATVENVQREPLAPMDEAEAFASMLLSGAAIDDVAAKAGISNQTVKRRVALASLCKEAKAAVRSEIIPLSVAEALTLGTAEQQRAILESGDIGEGADADDIRAMLIGHKPTVAIAIFPTDRYAGSYTADLFSDQENTFFDDVDQFMTLQRQAVDELAERYRQTAAFVEVAYSFNVPWWQYEPATEGQTGGVVIHLHPSGEVEIREGLVKHEVEQTVVEQTSETPAAPASKRERPEFSVPLMQYVARQKTAAVQAALLGRPRQAKELAALLLLVGMRLDLGIRLSAHPALMNPPEDWNRQRSYLALDAECSRLADLLLLPGENGAPSHPAGLGRLIAGRGAIGLLAAVAVLSDEDLDRLITLLPILTFGQEVEERFDSGESIFNVVARALGVAMREWWTPGPTFLSLLRRDQVLAVATESGPRDHITRAAEMPKKVLVTSVAEFFQKPSENAEETAKANSWLPGFFRFPAVPRLNDVPDAS